MEIIDPRLPSEPAVPDASGTAAAVDSASHASSLAGIAPSDPELLFTGEEIADACFRGGSFPTLCREHLAVQTSRFSGCAFAGAMLVRMQGSDLLFRNCDLSNADLRGCSFHRVRFVDCRLSGANLSEMTGHHLQFERCKGEYLNFSFSRFRHVRFSDCRLHGVAFSDCRFEHTEFAACDLSQAEFFGTRLRGLSFVDSDIRGLRVREIASYELNGLKVSALQAADLARLLGVEIEE